MKALSKRQAARCENAKTKTCRCRCGGALHGSMRNLIEEDREANPAFFEELPEDDPHHVRSQEEKKRRRRKPRSPADPGLRQWILEGVQQLLWPEEE
jgi:hypothetical protein